MLTVVLLSIPIFATAMTVMAIGIIFKGRPLRGSCCGGRSTAGGGAEDLSCPSCPEKSNKQEYVQISVGSLERR